MFSLQPICMAKPSNISLTHWLHSISMWLLGALGNMFCLKNIWMYHNSWKSNYKFMKRAFALTDFSAIAAKFNKIIANLAMLVLLHVPWNFAASAENVRKRVSLLKSFVMERRFEKNLLAINRDCCYCTLRRLNRLYFESDRALWAWSPIINWLF